MADGASMQGGVPTPNTRDKSSSRATSTCDGCALRRVRCDAGRPCSECRKRCLPCTTLRARRKRGPKGPRQTTNEKIRKFQQDLQLANDTGEGDEAPASQEEAQGVYDEENEADKNPDGPPYTAAGSTTPSSSTPGEAISPGLVWGGPPPPPPPKPTIGPCPVYTRQPLGAYCKFLGVFAERLYSVWPVVSCDSLIRRLVGDEDDYESWALAASVCAGVIAQLRLPEHFRRKNYHHHAHRTSGASGPFLGPPSPSPSSSTSHDFARDAEHFRSRHDYREQLSVASLLTSFFLHIYCANGERLRTAGFHLRESLTQAHMLGLHRPETYAALSYADDERELRLRVYWVLFVSERTYCVQHGLPTILRPISERPAPDHVLSAAPVSPGGYGGGSPIVSFLYLTRLFTFLDSDLIEPPSTSMLSAPGPGGVTSPGPPQTVIPGARRSPTDGGLGPDSGELDRARSKVTVFQSTLDPAADPGAVGLDETQRVDIFVTRNWIRILLWEYTVRHFTMSCTADDQAFSMLLPALVAHEMLGFFSTVSGESICAHGYGMELKVFRIADALLDVLACGRPGSGPGLTLGTASSMLVGSRDALHSLEHVLSTVGGSESHFLGRLRRRMAGIQLPVAAAGPVWLQLPWPGDHPHNHHRRRRHHHHNPRYHADGRDDDGMTTARVEDIGELSPPPASGAYFDDIGVGFDVVTAAALGLDEEAPMQQLFSGFGPLGGFSAGDGSVA